MSVDQLPIQRIDVADEPLGPVPLQNVRAGPRAHGGQLLGIDRSSGRVRWRKSLPGPVWSSPGFLQNVNISSTTFGITTNPVNNGSPRNLYEQPANEFVMRFVGPVSELSGRPALGRVSGGGARSRLWLSIIASVLELPLQRVGVVRQGARQRRVDMQIPRIA